MLNHVGVIKVDLGLTAAAPPNECPAKIGV